MPARGLAQLLLLAALVAAAAAGKVASPIVGYGTDGRPIFSSPEAYIQFANSEASSAAVAASLGNHTEKTCKPAPEYRTKGPFPKGIVPDGFCDGKKYDFTPYKPPQLPKTKPEKLPPSTYNTEISKGNQGKVWNWVDKNAQSLGYHVVATAMKTASVSAASIASATADEQCPGMSCLTGLGKLNLKFSLPLKVGSSTLDIGKYLDISKIVNDFLNTVGKTLCALSFTGAQITDGTWLNKLLGTNNALVTKLGSMNPLFKEMPLRDDISYLVMGYAYGDVPTTVTDENGKTMNASLKQQFDGLVSKGFAVAVNPCTFDIYFQFAGLEADFILGTTGLKLTLGLDAFAYSYQGKIPSDLNEDVSMNRFFWKPSAGVSGFVAVPAVAPTGHIYIAGNAALAPVTSTKGAFEMSAKGDMKLMVNYDPLGNNNLNTLSTFADFRVLANAAAAPILKLPNEKSIDFAKAGFQALANLYMAYDADGFTLAAGLNITSGSLLSLISQLDILPGAVIDAVKKVFDPVLSPPLKSANVYGGADEWGLRIQTSLTSTGTFAAIGLAMQVISMIWKDFPKSLDPIFIIKGKSKGNGLPIGLTFGLPPLGSLTFYFCSASSECPAGFGCNMGICSTTTCPDGQSPNSAIICPLQNCKPGYAPVDYLGSAVCMETCGSGETTVLWACHSCPAGKEYSVLRCYDTCRDGYSSVSFTCWQNCPSGYNTILLGTMCEAAVNSYAPGISCSWRSGCSCKSCSDGRWNRVACYCWANKYFRSTYARGWGSSYSSRNRGFQVRFQLPRIALPS